MDHGELSRGLRDVCLQRDSVQPRIAAAGRNVCDPQDPLGLARIDAGLEQCLFMGNLDSLRDWGHARDYVEMQWRMLQQESPEDFVIATGRQKSVRHFIELAALELGWGALVWQGTGRRSTGHVVVRIDPRYFRPAKIETVLGDPSKAHEKLGWTPTTTL
jgi:GDPmannose 4,6-dehydratase